jgi:hypothetical protein
MPLPLAAPVSIIHTPAAHPLPVARLISRRSSEALTGSQHLAAQSFGEALTASALMSLGCSSATQGWQHRREQHRTPLAASGRRPLAAKGARRRRQRRASLVASLAAGGSRGRPRWQQRLLPMLQGNTSSKTQSPDTTEDREEMNKIPYASVIRLKRIYNF